MRRWPPCYPCDCVLKTGPTFLPKDPPLVHAGDEEGGRLSEAHEEVGHGQVDDEDIGWRPQAPAPAHTHQIK